jgi:hypothetical protein
MSKNTYFNGELIPSTSGFGRIGSSFAKNKEEAKAKFIENIKLTRALTEIQQNKIIQNPSLVSVDVTPANEDTCSKYTIRLPAEVAPRLSLKSTILPNNKNPVLNDLNDDLNDFNGGRRRGRHYSSRKRRRGKTKRRKGKKSNKSKRKR